MEFCSEEGLMLETSAPKLLTVVNLVLSTQLMIGNYPVMLSQ